MVKLFANLRKFAGTKEVLVEIDEGKTETGPRLAEVVSALVKQIPALAGQLLDNGKIRPHVIITINRHPTLDMDANVTEQDQIAIFPPIAGGQRKMPTCASKEKS